MPIIACQELTPRQSGQACRIFKLAGWRAAGQAGVVSAPQLNHDNHVNLIYATFKLLCILGVFNIV